MGGFTGFPAAYDAWYSRNDQRLGLSLSHRLIVHLCSFSQPRPKLKCDCPVAGPGHACTRDRGRAKVVPLFIRVIPPAMKLTLERAALLRALSHVQSVVERRNTIPI